MARERTKLLDPEVQAWLRKNPGWALAEGMLRKTFAFDGFETAMGFVNQVAEAAQAADHHPDIDIRFAKVTLALVTHDAGGVTQRDVALAERADGMARELLGRD